MTTPAIHTSENQVLPGARYDINPFTGQRFFVLSTSGIRQSRTQDRPQSQSTVVDASGWRSPTFWNHSGSYVTPCPASTMWYYTASNNISSYEDGAAWTNSVYGMPSFPEYLDRSATNKALLAVKNQKVNFSVAFGERKETAELFMSALHLADKAYSSLQKANPARWKDMLKVQSLFERNPNLRKEVMAVRKTRRGDSMRWIPPQNSKKVGKAGAKAINAFLEVQYGLRPFMGDVYGAVSSLNKKESSGDAYRVTVHGTTREITPISWFKSGAISGNYGYRVSGNVSHFCKVRLDYYLDNPFLATLSQLGITNPLHAGYELTRLSFVLDWALPIGDYLSAWDATLGYAFHAGSLTRFSKLTLASDAPVFVGPLGDGNRHGFTSLFPYRENRYNMTRIVLSSSPLPRAPVFKDPTSGLHVANAIALVAARLSL